MKTTIDIDLLLKTPTKVYSYYGANCNEFKLGRKVYEVIEDEDDGYRSCMKELVLVDEPTGIFYKRAFAKVTLRESNAGCNDFYELVDVKDGHVWLTFGTDYSEDYYPCFVFDPHPKAP